jgi:hypothetical protein
MTATTPTQSPAKTLPSRRCPNCADDLIIAPCGNCGWEPGLVPVALAQTSDGPVTAFVVEKRHKFMFISGILACVLGVITFGGGVSGGFAGGVVAGTIFGPLIFSAGVITLKTTRGGKTWWGLSAREKGLAVPGLVCGAFLGLLVIPVVLICVAMMKMSTDAWRG